MTRWLYSLLLILILCSSCTQRLDYESKTNVKREFAAMKELHARIVLLSDSFDNSVQISEILDVITRSAPDSLRSPVTGILYAVSPDVRSWKQSDDNNTDKSIAIYCNSSFNPSPRGSAFLGVSFDGTLIYFNEHPGF